MKKNSKVLVLLFVAVAVIGMSFSACAESNVINTTENVNGDDKRQEIKKPENQIIGKIVSIDSTNVVISVAERKQIEKTADGTKKEKQVDGTQREKPNMDEMYTLTGETKIINIASADFGKRFEKNNDITNNAGNQKGTGETKNYADYQVGDYVTIECTDATYQVAKTMHDGRMMGGGNRNGIGKKEKKDGTTD